MYLTLPIFSKIGPGPYGNALSIKFYFITALMVSVSGTYRVTGSLMA